MCRPGGRIALTTWTSDGNLFKMFQVMKAYMPPPAAPAPPSPFEWGNTDRIRQLLGEDFELKFERAVSYYREPSAEAAWETFSTSYGPTKVAGRQPRSVTARGVARGFRRVPRGFPHGARHLRAARVLADRGHPQVSDHRGDGPFGWLYCRTARDRKHYGAPGDSRRRRSRRGGRGVCGALRRAAPHGAPRAGQARRRRDAQRDGRCCTMRT